MKSEVSAVLEELRRFQREHESSGERWERYALVVSVVLVAAKVMIAVVHALTPLEEGVATILLLGGGVLILALVGHLPTLLGLGRDLLSPGRSLVHRTVHHAERRADASARLERFPIQDLREARRLISGLHTRTTSRLDLLVGAVGRLGIVPATGMLLASHAQLASSPSSSQAAMTPVHWVTVLTFVLYIAYAIAAAAGRRAQQADELLRLAAERMGAASDASSG